MSIATHIKIASTLIINARLVDLLFVIMFYLLILVFSMTICKHWFYSDYTVVMSDGVSSFCVGVSPLLFAICTFICRNRMRIQTI